MEWVAGRSRWPATPADGPLEEVVSRLVHLALLDQPPTVIMDAVARLGLRPPPRLLQYQTFAPTGRDLVLARLRSIARAGPPPPSLQAAAMLIADNLPATPSRLAMLLIESGLTAKALDPHAVAQLIGLWVGDPPEWKRQQRQRRYGRHSAVVGSPILADEGWPQQRRALSTVAARLERAGVVSSREVAAWLVEAGWPQRQRVSGEDALGAWGLIGRGSAVAWDRFAVSQLERRVMRVLVALGSLPLTELGACLRRAAGPRYELPDTDLLRVWFGEHPLMTLSSSEVLALAHHLRPDEQRLWLAPHDRIILDHVGPAGCSTAALVDAVMERGSMRSRGSAVVAIATAPYLRKSSYGRVALVPGFGRTALASGSSQAD